MLPSLPSDLQQEKKVVLGAETDGALWNALRSVLKHLDAKQIRKRWAVVGSQEIETFKVKVGRRRLRVESETYIGLSIRGPVDLVDRIEAMVKAALAGQPMGLLQELLDEEGGRSVCQELLDVASCVLSGSNPNKRRIDLNRFEIVIDGGAAQVEIFDVLEPGVREEMTLESFQRTVAEALKSISGAPGPSTDILR